MGMRSGHRRASNESLSSLATARACVLVALCVILSIVAANTKNPASATTPLSRGTTIDSVQSCTPVKIPTASADGSLDHAIRSQRGPGWIGGDTAYSTKLPDGQEAFDFSDTLIGTATAGGSATITGFVNNSELIGDPPLLSGDYLGTPASAHSLIPDTFDSTDHWWVAATFVENGKQLIFVNEYANQPGGGFSFSGRSGIAIMTIAPNGMPKTSFVQLIPTDAGTTWGNALTHDGFYTYVYGTSGSSSTGKFAGMKVARVPLGETLDSGRWQYWNGASYVGGESNAVPISRTGMYTGVTPQPSGIGYEAVAVAGSGRNVAIDVSFACAPQGPWSTPPVPVYTVPGVGRYSNEIAYTATFHPELASPGGLVVSYSTNTTAGTPALKANIRLYQPRFLLLSDEPHYGVRLARVSRAMPR